MVQTNVTVLWDKIIHLFSVLSISNHEVLTSSQRGIILTLAIWKEYKSDLKGFHKGKIPTKNTNTTFFLERA